MWELDHKAEQWRIDALELWCWRRLLRVPWTARGSNQSILKEISPEYSLEGLMLKLKLQYFGHLMRRTNWKRPWCCERLTTGGEGDDRGWDGWMASPTRWAWVWASSESWWWKGSLMCCSPWGHRVGHNWATEVNWKTAKMPALKTPVLHIEEAQVYHPVLTFFSGSQFWMPVVITWEVKSV